MIPELIRRIDHYYPAPGAAPPDPPLPDVVVVQPRHGLRYTLTAILAAAAGAAAAMFLF
jgi:ubiquinone biosynthesis protein